MRKVYLLSLLVLVVLFLVGCADLVQYDKGYQEFDGVSDSHTVQETEAHDATPTHEDEGSDLENIEVVDENSAENAHE